MTEYKQMIKDITQVEVEMMAMDDLLYWAEQGYRWHLERQDWVTITEMYDNIQEGLD